LLHDEEGDDLDVVMLAAATREYEANPLVVQIVERHIAPGALGDELAAGKLIVDMHQAYIDGKQNAISLDPKLWRLYYDLGQPSWLIMLARNCEYATGMASFRSRSMRSSSTSRHCGAPPDQGKSSWQVTTAR
jgi:hypothetical protein